jgi:hypothetical protein
MRRGLSGNSGDQYDTYGNQEAKDQAERLEAGNGVRT